MSDQAIETRSLSHAFKKHQALDNVSFTVDARSIHGFVGPNGAGKTTTLKVLATLLPPQRGAAAVFGLDVRRQYRQVRRCIGFMPDQFSMYRQMTVFEYLDFFAAAYGLNFKQRQGTVGDVLALTDMDGRRDSLIKELSRGMQQRLSLARVLVHDPALLLLDEPASGLDPRARIELMQILGELKQMGKTVFISSHILSELAEICDSVTILDRGQVRYSGPMDGLLAEQSDERTYRLLLASEPAAQLQAALRQIEGIVEVTVTANATELRVRFAAATISLNAVLQAAMAAGAQLCAVQQDRKHLNQAFMELTTEGVRS